jgi:methionyl aminopeptidase
VHGLPTGQKLVEGDLLKLDTGAKLDGWYTDAAITVEVGKVSAEATRLREVTERALDIALEQVRPGKTVGDLGAAVQKYVEGEGMSVIRDAVGHGIGKKLHDEPSIPNFGHAGEGAKFKEGMVVAIEPMNALGGYEIKLQPDKWTLGMADGSLSAHVEETVMVTKGEPVRFTPVRQALYGQKSGDTLVKVPYGS